MKPPAPIVDDEVTNATRKVLDKVAEVYDPRLAAGAERFSDMAKKARTQWWAIGAIGTVVASLVGAGAYGAGLAKKSDVDEKFKVVAEEQSAVKIHMAALDRQMVDFVVSTSKALDSLILDAKHKDDVLLDIRLKLGASTVVIETKKGKAK